MGSVKSTRSLLRRGFEGLSLVRTGPAEHERYGEIPFVAGVLEDAIVIVADERNGKRPGIRVRVWIVDGHLVNDRVRIDRLEALDGVQRIAVGNAAEPSGARVRREPPVVVEV